MSLNRLKLVHITVVVLLVLLTLQFEFGMAVNLSDLPSLPPIALSLTNVLDLLKQAGPAAVLHAAMGMILVVMAVINLVTSLRSRVKGVQVFGVLGFLTMSLAALSGLLFVQSGLQDDHFSHGMATNFILTFAFYFLELYVLKPSKSTQ